MKPDELREAMLALSKIAEYKGDPSTPVRNSVKMRAIARAALAAQAAGVSPSVHTTQDDYEHFLSYSGLEHSPLLQYAYFHGADVGIEKPAPQPEAVEAVAWRVANHKNGPFALRKTRPKGWPIIQPLYTATPTATKGGE